MNNSNTKINTSQEFIIDSAPSFWDDPIGETSAIIDAIGTKNIVGIVIITILIVYGIKTYINHHNN